MATIKTIEYRCPHCNKKLPYAPRNEYCAINFKMYGDPQEVCRKCKKTYRNINLIEPAEALTRKDKVPFWITSVRTSVFFIILAIFAAVCTFGIGLVFVIPIYLVLCALTRKKRQDKKDQILLKSRNRLKDPECFVRYLFSTVYLSEDDRSKLTAQALSTIHYRAISEMDADQKLELSKIVRQVLGA